MQNGCFVEVGPLTCFISRQVFLKLLEHEEKLLTIPQSIPSDLKFDGNATPPQFTDNAGQIIERGTHIRVKLVGIRTELGQMFAVATIKEVRPHEVLRSLAIKTLTLFNLGLSRVS